MIELMIFDMDGLMFDTETLGLRAMRQAAMKYGFQLTDEFYTELVGTNGQVAKERIISHFGPSYPYEAVREEGSKLLKSLIEKEGITIKPGLLELLEYLKKKNIKTCVASSSARQTILRNLTMTHLKDQFAFLVAGDEVAKTKPNPEIFLKALAKAGCTSDKAMVLEDSQNGIIASHRAGIPVICIPDLKVPEPKIAELCETVLPSLDGVKNYLEQTKKVL